jgi:hypothetical protein
MSRYFLRENNNRIFLWRKIYLDIFAWYFLAIRSQVPKTPRAIARDLHIDNELTFLPVIGKDCTSLLTYPYQGKNRTFYIDMLYLNDLRAMVGRISKQETY